jgi:putative transcriptional regulator
MEDKMGKSNTTMSKLGQEILDGLRETLDFVKGKSTPGRATLMADGEAINIRAIREQLGMTRAEFALAFQFKTKTIQGWEQGMRRPTEHTLAYLRLIAADPKGVYEKLHQQQRRPSA